MSTSPPDQRAARADDPLDRLPLRERKKLKTRRAIQHHALRLFERQGYDGTTVEQIAAAAEISPSTFFRYFPTKEDVVVSDEYDPVMAADLRRQPPELHPVEAIRRVLRDLLPEMLDGGDGDTVLTRMRLTATVPSVRSRTFEAMRSGTQAMLRDVIAERAGRAPDDLEADALAWAVVGVLMSAMYAWLDGRVGMEDMPELIDHNLAFLAAGCPI
ncbi:acyl-CoA-like ligand-binding transcription factor [Actinomadura rupiterrae]|uniref:acyl-CoA-like ligand-binding transcription factor n=1 Tax=Actinomadura rupiterrae TaxID=559627 RepID=UPI0020A5C10E|nr:TetR family transcriptional regulator [Actinomadura rupiterrae]MCP2336742.1 AcrR family transcriptional regulator [Actinomadura rupiterrae]